MSTSSENSHRFASSIKAVAEVFGVPYSKVIEWRDNGECPFLSESPYDLDAISRWLDKQADETIDTDLELRRRKLEVEVQELERKGKVFSKDKAFWMAAVALGIEATREIREWLDEDSNEPPEPGKPIPSRDSSGTDIDALVKQLSELTVTEVGDLVMALEKRWGVDEGTQANEPPTPNKRLHDNP
jgi:hypothetical protein